MSESLFILESKGISTVPSDARVYALRVTATASWNLYAEPLRLYPGITHTGYAVALQESPRSGA